MLSSQRLRPSSPQARLREEHRSSAPRRGAIHLCVDRPSTPSVGSSLSLAGAVVDRLLKRNAFTIVVDEDARAYVATS